MIRPSAGCEKVRHEGVVGVGWAFNQPRRSAATPGRAPRNSRHHHPVYRLRLPVNRKQIRVFRSLLMAKAVDISPGHTRTPPHPIKRGVQFHKALMPRDPFPRFRLSTEATHRGWIAAGYDDLDGRSSHLSTEQCGRSPQREGASSSWSLYGVLRGDRETRRRRASKRHPPARQLSRQRGLVPTHRRHQLQRGCVPPLYRCGAQHTRKHKMMISERYRRVDVVATRQEDHTWLARAWRSAASLSLSDGRGRPERGQGPC